VVLAAITIRTKNVADSDIDNATYRRYVASFGDWWFRCAAPTATPSPTPQPPSPTPTPTAPPAPLLKVQSVNIVHRSFGPNDPERRIASPQAGQPAVAKLAELPNTIEVQFANAALDFGSVVDQRSFIVEGPNGPLSGQIVTMPNNTVRWHFSERSLPSGEYRVTLLGDDPSPIVSQQGRRLDGEFRQLPSGNDSEGGNFVFGLLVQQG